MLYDNLNIRRLLSVLSIIFFFSAASLLNAQEKAPQRRSTAGETDVGAELPNTRIGDSGYKVTIPEIKLRSIIGGKPEERVVPQEPQAPQQQLDQLPSKEEPAGQGSGAMVDRLPFDPVDVAPPPSIPTPPSAASSSETAQTKESKTETVTSGSEEGHETATSEPRPSPPVEEVNPVYHPPAAPEETLDTTFVPKKDVLRGDETPKQPPIAVLRPRSYKSSRLEISTSQAKELLSPEEWLALDARKPPLVVQLPEPEREGIRETPQQVAEDRDSSVSPTSSQETQQPEPPIVSVPSDSPAASQPVEKTAPEVTHSEQSLPEESIVTHEKERIPTPLDDDALDSREARDYLRETAPILEELSLLMTRAPGLTLEDYDPSDTNSTLVPSDVRVKITSLKRDLQVLDSKTFAIIPPPRYQAFHSLVRESIAHAYQACDAIINYFEEHNPENFIKAKEHLVKAGDLIRRTVKGNGSS